MEKNSQMVLNKGKKIFLFGKILTAIWIAAWIIMILTILITISIDGSEGIPYVLSFNVDEEYTFTIPIVMISYLGIFLGTFGPVCYLCGLHLIGLGQIALNTDKDSF